MSGSRIKLAALYGQLANTYAELCRELGGTVDAAGAGGQIATDRDLDGQYGDEIVKRDPKRWDGPSFANRRMSECSPEFLDCLAEFAEWAAERDDEKARGGGPDSEKCVKYARYGRTRAARARGWARRLRSGWSAPARNDAPPSGGFNGGDAPSAGFDGGAFDPDGFGES